jgi:hypothetical protein
MGLSCKRILIELSRSHRGFINHFFSPPDYSGFAATIGFLLTCRSIGSPAPAVRKLFRQITVDRFDFNSA